MPSKITSDILFRVFRIYVGDYSGTSFTMEHNGIQYLITAKHLFESVGFPNETIVGVLQNHKIINLSFTIEYCGDPVDIAILKPNPYLLLSKTTPAEFKIDGTTYGEEAFFVGYPLDYDITLMNMPKTFSPIPFVKRCLVSCFLEKDLIALDGINNPGFSGAPVFRVDGKKTIVIGVISGYRYNASYIYQSVESSEIKTLLYTKENTGIIYAYSIKPVVDFLNKKYLSKGNTTVNKCDT